MVQYLELRRLCGAAQYNESGIEAKDDRVGRAM